MLDIKYLRENTEEATSRLKRREPDIDLNKIIEIDAEYRKALSEAENLKSILKKNSKEIGIKKKAGESTEELMQEMAKFRDEIKEKENKADELKNDLNNLLSMLPNYPHPDVPTDPNKKNNKLIRDWGQKREFDFKFMNHVEIGARHDWFDFERGAKISGSQWPLYKGWAARLEYALINFMIDFNIKKGFQLIIPPFLANEATLYTSGNLPKFADQLYKCRDDELYMIPTSEVSLTSMHRDEIVLEDDLPIYYTSYSPCFRREAGTYGAEERGLVRVHQFNKVETYVFCTPEKSYEELEKMTSNVEDMLQALELHYRTMLLVTGDLGQQAAKTYDVEVWLPGQDAYYEVSSCSNCEDYQARRGNIRYRPKGEKQKPQFVHTLNGSALATSRLLISIVENNQESDGRVRVPKVLQPYMGGVEYIPAL